MPPNARPTGWRPQPHDPNDDIYVPPSQGDQKAVDLTTYDAGLKEPYNQYFLSSCVANAVAAALKFGVNAEYSRKWVAHYNPSRLWLYWCGRLLGAVGEPVARDEIEKFLHYLDVGAKGAIPLKQGGSMDYEHVLTELKKDGGTQARDVIRALPEIGVCPDDKWSYELVKSHWEFLKGDSGVYPVAVQSQLYTGDHKKYWSPSRECFTIAETYMDTKLQFYRIKDLAEPIGPSNTNLISDMEAALLEGFPVIFGLVFGETNGFVTDDDHVYRGIVLNGSEKTDGHCVLCVGYDRSKKQFKVLNSWGKDWGDEGYFYVPYSVFEPSSGTFQQNNITRAYADDIWVIKVSTNKKVQ